MLYYDRIEASEGINVNKTGELKVWYFSLLLFLDKTFKFQSDVCNGCHDVSMMSKNLNHISILNIHGANYCCIISRISKSEAVNLMQNINLT